MYVVSKEEVSCTEASDMQVSSTQLVQGSSFKLAHNSCSELTKDLDFKSSTAELPRDQQLMTLVVDSLYTWFEFMVRLEQGMGVTCWSSSQFQHYQSIVDHSPVIGRVIEKYAEETSIFFSCSSPDSAIKVVNYFSIKCA